MSGIRHVTGSDDPARNGNLSSREMSTISLAHSHFHERCLSLKTGTVWPSLAEDLGDLLEELVARILVWPISFRWYFAVLADDQHGIHRELVSAAPESLGNGRDRSEPELLGPLARLRSFSGDLIDVGRDDVDAADGATSPRSGNRTRNRSAMCQAWLRSFQSVVTTASFFLAGSAAYTFGASNAAPEVARKVRREIMAASIEM